MSDFNVGDRVLVIGDVAGTVVGAAIVGGSTRVIVELDKGRFTEDRDIFISSIVVHPSNVELIKPVAVSVGQLGVPVPEARNYLSVFSEEFVSVGEFCKVCARVTAWCRCEKEEIVSAPVNHDMECECLRCRSAVREATLGLCKWDSAVPHPFGGWAGRVNCVDWVAIPVAVAEEVRDGSK